MIGKGTKVEIVFSGTRRIVLINGMPIPRSISIETPRNQGEVPGQVHLKFFASEIIEREVNPEEFKQMRDDVGKHDTIGS